MFVHNSRLGLGCTIVLGILVFPAEPSWSQTQEETPYEKAQRLPWSEFPNVLSIDGVATLNPGVDTKFLSRETTKNFLVISGNLPDDAVYAVADNDLSWWSLLS